MKKQYENLGYYTLELYEERVVLDVVDRAIRDFENEKELFLERPLRSITYYCTRCLYFIIDYSREYRRGDRCYRCRHPLKHVDKLFVKRYSKLLSKYSMRVKPVIVDLFRILVEQIGFSILNYSILYVKFNNHFTSLTETTIYPFIHDGKFKMYLSIILHKFNTEYLDVVDSIENLYTRYGLVGYIGIYETPRRAERLVDKQYIEKPFGNRFDYYKYI
jgi:hypothetical protein